MKSYLFIIITIGLFDYLKDELLNYRWFKINIVAGALQIVILQSDSV